MQRPQAAHTYISAYDNNPFQISSSFISPWKTEFETDLIKELVEIKLIKGVLMMQVADTISLRVARKFANFERGWILNLQVDYLQPQLFQKQVQVRETKSFSIGT